MKLKYLSVPAVVGLALLLGPGSILAEDETEQSVAVEVLEYENLDVSGGLSLVMTGLYDAFGYIDTFYDGGILSYATNMDHRKITVNAALLGGNEHFKLFMGVTPPLKLHGNDAGNPTGIFRLEDGEPDHDLIVDIDRVIAKAGVAYIARAHISDGDGTADWQITFTFMADL